ncbi:hypothetical protein SK128_000161, partial [Halocaridina rubra]
ESYIINSLSDDTLYVLRAYAKNAAGYSDFSEEIMGKTKKVQALNVTSSSNTMSFFTFYSSFILLMLVFL